MGGVRHTAVALAAIGALAAPGLLLANPAAASAPAVRFDGGGLLGLPLLACGSHPDVTTIDIHAGETVAIDNATGHNATIDIAGPATHRQQSRQCRCHHPDRVSGRHLDADPDPGLPGQSGRRRISDGPGHRVSIPIRLADTHAGFDTDREPHPASAQRGADFNCNRHASGRPAEPASGHGECGDDPIGQTVPHRRRHDGPAGEYSPDR
jgi:hypothetical protein